MSKHDDISNLPNESDESSSSNALHLTKLPQDDFYQEYLCQFSEPRKVERTFGLMHLKESFDVWLYPTKYNEIRTRFVGTGVGHIVPSKITLKEGLFMLMDSIYEDGEHYGDPYIRDYIDKNQIKWVSNLIHQTWFPNSTPGKAFLLYIPELEALCLFYESTIRYSVEYE